MKITIEQAAQWFERRAMDTPMPATKEMFHMAAEALWERAERENPRPLTLEELADMEDVPFYVQMPDVLDDSVWVQCFYPAIIDTVNGVDVAIWCGQEGSFLKFSDYGTKWIAYRHKPKGVQG